MVPVTNMRYIYALKEPVNFSFAKSCYITLFDQLRLGGLIKMFHTNVGNPCTQH